MILSDVRDPRLITVRRGGTLLDDDHHRLAVWAADCAEHVLGYFERRGRMTTGPVGRSSSGGPGRAAKSR